MPAQHSVTVKDAVDIAKLNTRQSATLELAPKESFKEAQREATRAFHNEALDAVDIAKLNIQQSATLELAKESFKEAQREATRAFHNEALGTKERILATQVRIVSGILANLEHPEIAASDCLQYLKGLHDIQEIKKIFSVCTGFATLSRLRSLFNKDSRTEIAKTVTVINVVLADFISTYTKTKMALFDWPMIECDTIAVHPIYCKTNVQRTKKMEKTSLWNVVRYKEPIEQKRDLGINSKGNIIFVFDDRDCCRPEMLDRETREFRSLWLPHSGLRDYVRRIRKNWMRSWSKRMDFYSVAIDDDDTVYVLLLKYIATDGELRDCPCLISYLFAISPDFHNCVVGKLSISVYSPDEEVNDQNLDFITESVLAYGFTVTKDKKIVIYSGNADHDTVYICDKNGRLEKSFPIRLKSRNETIWGLLASCAENEIIVATKRNSANKSLNLYAYKQEGGLKRTFKLGPILYSVHHTIMFDHETRNYIVCSGNREKTICVERFSEHGKLLNSRVLPVLDNFITDPSDIWGLASHSGEIALVNSKYVVYLQSSLKNYCSVGAKIVRCPDQDSSNFVTDSD